MVEFEVEPREVTISLKRYDELIGEIHSRKDELNRLYSEMDELKKKHAKEIESMIEEGKVRVIRAKRIGLLPWSMKFKTKYLNFDDVKEEVYQHFKDGLFDDEFKKAFAERIEALSKEKTENMNKILDLEHELRKLKNRSWWQRLFNI